MSGISMLLEARTEKLLHLFSLTLIGHSSCENQKLNTGVVTVHFICRILNEINNTISIEFSATK
jgi:hypothetical protein